MAGIRRRSGRYPWGASVVKSKTPDEKVIAQVYETDVAVDGIEALSNDLKLMDEDKKYVAELIENIRKCLNELLIIYGQ